MYDWYMLLALFLVFMISVFPITLVKLGVVPRNFRFLVLFGVVLLVGVLGYWLQLGFWEYYAFSLVSFETVVWYGFMVVAAVYGLYFARFIFKTGKAHLWHKDPHFQFLFVPISFAQQFLFQGFILTILLGYFNPIVSVIVTAVLFGYLHTIYPRPVMSFFVGSIGGLLFASVFVLHPDLLVSSVAHSILNFTAVYLGFFSFRYATPPATARI